MSLADPLTIASFADLLGASDVQFALDWAQQRSLSGGGETLYADRGPARWMAKITTEPMLHADAEAIMALINSRAGGLKTVLLYNKRLAYPSSDPDGSIWTAAAPTALVGTITDRTHVAFTGFPNGYVIPAGTFLGIVFGSTRRYLGQFAEAKTADGSGALSATEIAPPLPASVAPGNAVTVTKPAGKFRITPGTAYPSIVGGLHSSVQFSAEQTYTP